MLENKRYKTDGEEEKKRCKGAAVGAAAERERACGSGTAAARIARGAEEDATASAWTSPSTPVSPCAVRSGHAIIAPPRGGDQRWLSKSLTT